MKYLFFLSVVFLVACQGKNTTNTVPKKPSPKRFYNDFTGSKFLSEAQASTIESKLLQFNKETSNEIVVVIVNDFGGVEPAEFGTKLGVEWGVGNKDLDNGVVLLIKPTEKRKVFIATGRGTETILTDIQAKEIVDNQIIPSLKINDFYSGIDKGLSSIMVLLKGGNNSPEPSVGNASSNYSSTENSNNPEIDYDLSNEGKPNSTESNLYIYLFVFSFSVGLLIYLFGWLFYGIDPKKGKIEISSLPPTDISPATLNAIINQEFNAINIFKLSLLSLAAKKIIQIKYNHLEQNEFLLAISFQELEKLLAAESNKNSSSSKVLSNEEKTVLKTLFSENNSSYRLPNEPNEKFGLFVNQLKSEFETEHKNKFFRDNIAFWTIGLITHLLSVVFFFIQFSIGLSIVYLIAVFILFAIMVKLIHKYTLLGRKYMDKIDGFKLFMNQTNYKSINYTEIIHSTSFDYFFTLCYCSGKIDSWFDHYSYLSEKYPSEYSLTCFVSNDLEFSKENILVMLNSVEREIKISSNKSKNSSTTPLIFAGSNSNSSDNSSSSWSSSDSGSSDFGGGDFGGGGAGGDW